MTMIILVAYTNTHILRKYTYKHIIKKPKNILNKLATILHSYILLPLLRTFIHIQDRGASCANYNYSSSQIIFHNRHT